MCYSTSFPSLYLSFFQLISCINSNLITTTDWLTAVSFLTVCVLCFVFPEEQQKDEEVEEEPLTGKDEEERRIAEMGRPMLGDHVKLEVIIEESYEFKVRRSHINYISNAGTFQPEGELSVFLLQKQKPGLQKTLFKW